MGLILDTIVYSKLLFDVDNLPNFAQNSIAQQEVLLVTIPTLWEMSNHVRKGIYSIDKDFETYFKQANEALNIQVIPIMWQAINWLSVTPYVVAHGKPHKDTFDRMIIAHAILTQNTIITQDSAFLYYEVLGLNLIML